MTTQKTHRHDMACPAATPRLTSGRRLVLDILEREQRPVGAYEMINFLASGDGKRPAPTQVYRALDFLVEHGLAHRLASRNAFLACRHIHHAFEPVAFLICDHCGCVDEATSDELTDDLMRLAATAGFTPRTQIIEIAGLCARCQLQVNA